MVLVHQTGRRNDLPRGAVAALEGIMRNKCPLQRVQATVGSQSFNGGDVGVCHGQCQSQTTVDASSVDEDRAGTALAVVAALFGASQSETFAQQVEEHRPWLDLEIMWLSVDGDAERRGAKAGIGHSLTPR